MTKRHDIDAEGPYCPLHETMEENKRKVWEAIERKLPIWAFIITIGIVAGAIAFLFNSFSESATKADVERMESRILRSINRLEEQIWDHSREKTTAFIDIENYRR